MQKPQNTVVIVYLEVPNKNINCGFCCKMWMFLMCLTKSRHLTGLLKRTPVWFRYVNTAVGARPASGVSCPVSSGVKGRFLPLMSRPVDAPWSLDCHAAFFPWASFGVSPPPLWAAYFAVWKLLLDPHCPQHKIHSPSCGRLTLLLPVLLSSCTKPRPLPSTWGPSGLCSLGLDALSSLRTHLKNHVLPGGFAIFRRRPHSFSVFMSPCSHLLLGNLPCPAALKVPPPSPSSSPPFMFVCFFWALATASYFGYFAALPRSRLTEARDALCLFAAEPWGLGWSVACGREGIQPYLFVTLSGLH